MQDTKSIQNLTHKDPDEVRTQAAKLVLLDKFVEIDAEHFKDDAEMVLVDKRVFHAANVVLIVWVVFIIELDGGC